MISDCGQDLQNRVQSQPLQIGNEFIINTVYKIKQISIDCSQGFNSPAVLAVYKNGIEIGRNSYISSGVTSFSYDNGNLCVALWFYDCQNTPPRITYDIWYSSVDTSTTKAVEFGTFWADNLDDVTLKTLARYGIMNVGDELTLEPVYRQNGMAYVLFNPAMTKYTEFNIVAGLTRIAAAAFAWVKANPGKATLLLASVAYISIRIIDWQTKVTEKEIAISEDTTVKSIIADTTLTPEQKITAIEAYLKGKAGTDWTTIAMIGAAAILGYAFLSRK